MQNIEIYKGGLDTDALYKKWYDEIKTQNLGAFITFSGIIRDDDGVEALSFDIYEKLLQNWFNGWQKRVKDEKVENEKIRLFFAHSFGDVKVGQSSYFTAIASKQRKVALRLISEFVEDFKANAPIWKYDVKNGTRIYAENRSFKLKGAGLLKG